MNEGTSIQTFNVLFEVDKAGFALVIDSDPDILKTGVLDGNDLKESFIDNKEDIPTKAGSYKCIIEAKHIKYWTEYGYEYDCRTKIKDIKKI